MRLPFFKAHIFRATAIVLKGSSLSGCRKMSHAVEGSVAAGYEPVREMFEKNFELGREQDAQCCVYVEGKKV